MVWVGISRHTGFPVVDLPPVMALQRARRHRLTASSDTIRPWLTAGTSWWATFSVFSHDLAGYETVKVMYTCLEEPGPASPFYLVRNMYFADSYDAQWVHLRPGPLGGTWLPSPTDFPLPARS